MQCLARRDCDIRSESSNIYISGFNKKKLDTREKMHEKIMICSS